MQERNTIMKKAIAIFAALVMLFAFAACKKETVQNKDGYIELLDNSMELMRNYSEELARKVMPEGMVDSQVKANEERGRDFFALLEQQFSDQRASYAATYGDDWKISYTVNEAVEKDKEGIENYKAFDAHYFETYGIDTSKITAVTFAKVTVRIEGSRDSNEKDKTIQCFLIDGKWYSFYAVMMGLRL